MTPGSTPDHILQVGMGFWASKTLLSAVELEVFTVLGTQSMTGDQIGDGLGLSGTGSNRPPGSRLPRTLRRST